MWLVPPLPLLHLPIASAFGSSYGPARDLVGDLPGVRIDKFNATDVQMDKLDARGIESMTSVAGDDK